MSKLKGRRFHFWCPVGSHEKPFVHEHTGAVGGAEESRQGQVQIYERREDAEREAVVYGVRRCTLIVHPIPLLLPPEKRKIRKKTFKLPKPAGFLPLL